MLVKVAIRGCKGDMGLHEQQTEWRWGGGKGVGGRQTPPPLLSLTLVETIFESQTGGRGDIRARYETVTHAVGGLWGLL